MNAAKLLHIVKTRRGITYLRKRLLEVDPSLSHHIASAKLNTIWTDKTLTDEAMYEAFAKMLLIDKVAISKEQLLHMVEKVMDHSGDFYMDYLDALETLCANIRKNGGLQGLARKIELFSNQI